MPKTPWGDPDLQGVWNDATSTPLQRPSGVGKDVLTDEEAAEFQEQLAHDLTRDRRDGGADADVNRAYNEHWMDARRLKITADHRTSLIVDPPDGRIPPLTPLPPERQKPRARRGLPRTRASTPACRTTTTDMSLPVRCIIRTDSPPYLPTIYNNDFQIFQSPGFVVIAPEMIHSARMIPLDGRPHLDKNLHQWLGDSRGHWDGTTLVVETTNFRTDDGVVFQDANPETFKITERFTRVDADVDQLRVHGRRSDDLDEAVDRADSVDQDRSRRADVRVRLPRRQLRHRPLPDRRAETGEKNAR